MNAFHASRPLRLRPQVAFALVALLCFAIDGVIAHSPAFAERPDLFTGAVTFDLTLGVTFAYWLIVVRRGKASLRSILPVFVASIAAAAVTLPPGHRDLVRYARYLAAPFELGVIVAITLAVRSAQRRLTAAGTMLDIPERIRSVLSTSMLAPRIADIIATEVSMFYYALLAWRRKPFAPEGALAFSYHKKSGYAALLYALAGACCVELAVVDIVVRTRAPGAANVFIVLGAFSALWLLGFARAVQLRPVLVNGQAVLVRNGLRAQIDLPRDAIASIDVGRRAFEPSSTAGYLRVGMGTSTVALTLREPLRVHGAYGTSKLVSRLALALDEPTAFAAALSAKKP